jgi:hypothetical protein
MPPKIRNHFLDQWDARNSRMMRENHTREIGFRPPELVFAVFMTIRHRTCIGTGSANHHPASNFSDWFIETLENVLAK